MCSIFSCAFWPSVCLLWRNVYLSLPSIFWSGVICFTVKYTCIKLVHVLIGFGCMLYNPAGVNLFNYVSGNLAH